MKKNILVFVNRTYFETGVSHYIKSILSAYNEFPNEFNINCLYTHDSWDNQIYKYNNIYFIKIQHSKSVDLILKLVLLLKLHSFIKKITPLFSKQINYINNSNNDLIIFPAGDIHAAFVKKKNVVAIHDLMHIYEKKFKESGGLLNYTFRQNYYSTILNSSLAVFVDSDLGEKHVLDNFKSVKSKIFKLPYIAPDYIYEYLESSSINNSYREKLLFYPATFWPHKNHINLILAFKELLKYFPDYKLILSGKRIGKHYKKLTKIVKYYEIESNVLFVGYLNNDEIISYYNKSLVLVMPTFYGPTNIPPIEALLLGCIPIVSNNYAMSNQFENSALYFNPNNVWEIFNCLKLILSNADLQNNLLFNAGQLKNKFSKDSFKAILFDNINSIYVIKN
jgi:glycosyltransferase involved in cell wall biosynthesis